MSSADPTRIDELLFVCYAWLFLKAEALKNAYQICQFQSFKERVLPHLGNRVPALLAVCFALFSVLPVEAGCKGKQLFRSDKRKAKKICFRFLFSFSHPPSG